ncbi:hypothetical protein H8356DRAFT_1328519 [Neocallimastix lanati (nom. inval.)]|nr:hypothetical protein H8356DRAFT_1328519 [Neocallimastix sp. JGI-2020a]
MEENLIIYIEILKYYSSHNHPEKEYDVSLSIMKHKIKDGIEKSSIPFELPSNVTTFVEIHNESELKLFREYDDDIFVDGTFFITPKFSYQIFITRTYAKELDTAKTVFPNTNIKYCIWHYKKSLEIKKNKLCYNEVKNDNNIFIYYKAISNLPFINPKYIFDIYVIIKIKSIKNN